MLVTVELPHLATFLNAEEVFASTQAGLLVKVEPGHLIGIARQLRQFRGSGTPVHTCCPLEVLGLHGIVVQADLQTRVLRRTDIHQNSAIDERRLRSSVVIEQVLGAAVEVLDATAQATVQRHEVKTHVEGGRFLPSQVGVGIQCRCIAVDPLTVQVVLTITAVGRHRLIGREVRATRHTIGDARLQALEHSQLLFQSGSLGSFPSQRHRREGTPLFIGTELGAAFVTK